MTDRQKELIRKLRMNVEEFKQNPDNMAQRIEDVEDAIIELAELITEEE